MNAGRFTLPIACPFCAGDVELAAPGTTTTWATCALLRCTDCRVEVVVRISLHDAGKRATEGAERQRAWRARRGELMPMDIGG